MNALNHRVRFEQLVLLAVVAVVTLAKLTEIHDGTIISRAEDDTLIFSALVPKLLDEPLY